MTVQELIEELNYVNPDAEIRFASQPSWPFEYSFSGPVEVEDEEGFPTVYLVEGRQIGYLPGQAKDEIGW
jgi:hypothetical protein